MVRTRLRTKLLLLLILTTAALTGTSLLIVQLYLDRHAREDISELINSSLITFEHFSDQRQRMLAQSAEIAANLPTVKALMTTHHEPTIQDASKDFPGIAGGDLFLLADPTGKVMALQTTMEDFSRADAQMSLFRSLEHQLSRDWWFGGGHLYEVCLHPIYLGSPQQEVPLGILAIGFEIDSRLASTVGRIASSEVAFRYGKKIVVSTLASDQQADLASHDPLVRGTPPNMHEIRLGAENFIGTTVELAPSGDDVVSLTVLKSYDGATVFLKNMNRLLLGVGVVAVLAGGCLMFLISDTFTRPLARLVSGVHALEKGDFAYPLNVRSRDELGELTIAFDRMRTTLLESQQHLLHAERLATIGRMASSISHDLRHPLAAVLAYAEILSDGNLSEKERNEIYQEVRLSVDKMTELIASLLEFSKAQETLNLADGDVIETLKRTINMIHLRPEFRHVPIKLDQYSPIHGRFDFKKLERAFHNLLQNAAESAPADLVQIAVGATRANGHVEITVTDNGPGIPDEIRDEIFQPFVTYGKVSGTGLGLAVVRKIVNDHGGEVKIESTGPAGTMIKVILPATAAAQPKAPTFIPHTTSL